MILRELFNYALYKFVKNTYNNYLIIKSNKINDKSSKPTNKINKLFKILKPAISKRRPFHM